MKFAQELHDRHTYDTYTIMLVSKKVCLIPENSCWLEIGSTAFG